MMILAQNTHGASNNSDNNSSSKSLIGYQRPAGFCVPLDLDYVHHKPTSTRTMMKSRSPFNSPGANSQKPNVVFMYRPKEILPLEQSPSKHHKVVVAASALRKTINSPISVVSEQRPTAFLPLSPTRCTNSPLSERGSVSKSGLKIKRVWMAEDFHKSPNSMMIGDGKEGTIRTIPASYASSADSENEIACLLLPPPLL
jgi:hypothetical protein